MSEKKPSTNKNIKKLRAISMVCSLTQSWQQWVCENEEKQSSEPSGWAPSYPEDPKDAKKVVPKIKPSQKSLSNQDSRNKKQDNVEAAEESRIKTAQVVKTVTREVQEKSAGIDFLTNRICKDPGQGWTGQDAEQERSPTLLQEMLQHGFGADTGLEGNGKGEKAGSGGRWR